MSENALYVARSKLANEVKKSKKAGPSAGRNQVEDARRLLAKEKLAEHIRRTVASAPPLTDAQKHEIAALLWSGK